MTYLILLFFLAKADDAQLAEMHDDTKELVRPSKQGQGMNRPSTPQGQGDLKKTPVAGQATLTYEDLVTNYDKMYFRGSIPIWVANAKSTSPKDRTIRGQAVLLMRTEINGVLTCVFGSVAHLFSDTWGNSPKTDFKVDVQTQARFFDPVKSGQPGYGKALHFGKVQVYAMKNKALRKDDFSQDVVIFEVTGDACKKSKETGTPPVIPILPASMYKDFLKLKGNTEVNLKTQCHEKGETCKVTLTGYDEAKGNIQVNERPASQQKSQKTLKLGEFDSGGGLFWEEGKKVRKDPFFYLVGLCSFEQFGNERACSGFSSGYQLEWLRNELAVRYGAKNVPELKR